MTAEARLRVVAVLSRHNVRLPEDEGMADSWNNESPSDPQPIHSLSTEGS